MPKDKDGNLGHAQNDGGSILQKIILLTIPVLNLQLQVLGTIKKNIGGQKADGADKHGSGDEDNLIRQLHHFAAFQLHALCMIFDRTGKLRRLIDLEHDEKLKSEIQAISEKVASGSVSLIEAQEKVIQSIIAVLNKVRNGKPAPGPTSAY
jgi:hypothetical protein